MLNTCRVENWVAAIKLIKYKQIILLYVVALYIPGMQIAKHSEKRLPFVGIHN